MAINTGKCYILRTFNPFVAGSNPARPTKKINGLEFKHSRPFFYPEHSRGVVKKWVTVAD